MARRSVAVLLSVVMLGGVCGWGFAGEGERPRPKRPERRRPEPISAEDFAAAIDELSALTTELEGDDAAAKLADLRNRAEGALKKLRLAGPYVARMLETQDPKALGRAVESLVYRAIVGRLRTERRRFIESKPELAETEKEFQDKEKQLRQEHEEFYTKLRTMSPELDKLEKHREELDAKRRERFKEMMERRRMGRTPRTRKKED